MILKEQDDKTLFKILNNKQKIKLTLHHKDGKTIEVTLIGNGIYCKDIRDIIVADDGWSQGNLSREVIDDV